MNVLDISEAIRTGEISLGIELGSTQIKAVLVTNDFNTIASGSYLWENKFENNVWTYSLEEVWIGIQESYTQLAATVQNRYHETIHNIGSIGISGMMHGYLAFSDNNQLLVPFRTWRNNITEVAADKLTKVFNFNIPQRWTIAHLYQAILNKEPHVKDIDFVTTLSGYVHWKLSGKKVLGVGDASGVFPIDSQNNSYRKDLLTKFSSLEKVKVQNWQVESILPKVQIAGTNGGNLTIEGAHLIDRGGNLNSGSMMAPPEGDAGTGMVGTNCIREKSGNISIGTSAFSMIVLERPLENVHRDIDIVTTPDGAPVAMVHTNNCSSDINAWINLFQEFATHLGLNLKPDELYERLFLEVVHADPDAGGLMNYSYLSGENITKIETGRPLFVRTQTSHFNLPNFIQTQLYSSFAPLKIGMDILVRDEHIHPETMIAQGGLFKTPVIGQQILSNALNIPITVMNTASEGGPWGMAILAIYTKNHSENQNLSDFLDMHVFKNSESMTLNPESEGVNGYQKFIQSYQAGLTTEKEAGSSIKLYKTL